MRLGRTGCAIPRIGCRRKTAALDRIAFRSVLSASAQFRWPSEIRWGCALQFTVHKATMPSRRSRLLWIGRIEAPRCARQSTDSRLYHRLFKRGSQGHAFAPHRLAGAGGGATALVDAHFGGRLSGGQPRLAPTGADQSGRRSLTSLRSLNVARRVSRFTS